MLPIHASSAKTAEVPSIFMPETTIPPSYSPTTRRDGLARPLP